MGAADSSSRAAVMKLTVLIVACMAIVAVQTASVQSELPAADKSILEKQRFVLDIVLRVDHELLIEEWIKLGGKLITDKTRYEKYDDWMVKFYDAYKLGGLLPRGEFFSVMQRFHIIQVLGLFNFFYYAKDWETFVHNVVWARMNANEGMFVYAFTKAVIHREDTKGLILPQIYEIFPQMFLSSKYIVEAEKFDWDNWNRKIMLEKELKSIYEQDPAGEVFGERFYLRDWKVWQWWKLMGLDDGWQAEEKSMLRENIQVMRDDPMWSSIYSNLKMAFLPVDYTRDIGIWNEYSTLSYFTEDVGWNAYWYYLNLDYSWTLFAKEFKLDKDRRGEWWIYNLQQMIARLNMERLSHGLPEIDMLSWHGVVKTGYNPQLIAYNGHSFSVRENYWQVESHQSLDILTKTLNVERRIQDAISSGYFVMKDGTKIDLTQPESLEVISNLLHSNFDVLDAKYFGYWYYYAIAYLSGEKYNEFTITPNVLMNYETMMRDPLAWSLFKIVIKIFQERKYTMPPYTKEELLLPGVEIIDVQVSKLMTYFDLVDIDVTTLLNDKLVWQDGKLIWNKALLARQMRLNHEPFNFDFEVLAEKAQKVVVRTFLGPVFDQYGQRIISSINRENFMELDEFITELVEGKNIIHRSSEDFSWTGSDPLTYSELYNYLTLSYEGKYQFQQNISQAHSLFPDRLILPHGWVKGMPVIVFFMISPYTADHQQYSTYDPSYMSGIGSGVRHIDDTPFGYPLDRKFDNIIEFLVPNMLFKYVKIYHKEKFDKYFPIEYENFGSFDYDY